MEVSGDNHSQSDRHRLKGWQLLAQRRAQRRGLDSTAERGTASRGGQVDESEWRSNLWDDGEPVSNPARFWARHQQTWSCVSAHIRLAGGWQATSSDVGRDGEEGLSAGESEG